MGQLEIEYAHKHNKLIIGVWAYGSAGCELPEALKIHHDALVSWNADRILAAFEGGRVSEEPDGSPREPQPMTRVSCG